LLAACKNLGVTHLTNGAYRLHPIEWNVGESAGALAAFCVKHGVEPKTVRNSQEILRDFQNGLLDAGIPIYWWGDLPGEHPAFRSAQRLAMDGIWPGGLDVLFRPDDPFTKEQRDEMGRLAGKPILWPAGLKTRGEAAIWLAGFLRA